MKYLFIKKINKKTIFSVFLLLLLPTFKAEAVGINSSLPNFGGDSLKTGLIGYWTFDGANMKSNVTDSSGSGNNGLLTNFAATSTVVTPGKLGQALKFDGVDDRVVVNDMTVLEGSSKATWSFWLKPNSVSSEKVLIAKWNSNSSETSFLITTGNGSGSKIQIYMNSASVAGSLSSSVLSVNKWTHVVIVYDGSQATNATKLSIYIDGTARSLTFNGSIPSTISATASNMNIGGFSNGVVTIGYTIGVLDDVRVYNRALTVNEISQIYNLGNSKFNEPLPNLGGDSLKTGLIGYWTFDGANMKSNVTDSSGSGNNGLLTNFAATSTVVTPGKLGQALKFDGTNDIVTTPQLSTGTGPFSISAWVKVDNLTGKSFNNGGAIIAHFNNDLAGDFALSITSGYSVSFLNNRTGGNDPTGESETSLNVVSKNKWAHVVAVWDGSVNKIYVNGVNKTFTSSAWGDWGTESGLGRLANLGLYHYKGLMDDVRVYNRALTVNEISQIYNLGNSKFNEPLPNLGGDSLKTGLIGYWTFDGVNMKSNVTDSSGNGNNGSMTNFAATSTVVTPGKLGQALKFDGVDDTVIINSIASSLNKNEGTFSAWVYAITYTGSSPFQADGIIEIGSSASSNDGISLSPSSTGNVSMNYRTSGVTTRATITGAPLRKWYHVAGTWNSSTISIYLNGVLSNSVANGTLTSVSLNQARIGSDSLGTAGQDYFYGLIDDVRIYNRVLNVSEIKQLYKLGI